MTVVKINTENAKESIIVDSEVKETAQFVIGQYMAKKPIIIVNGIGDAVLAVPSHKVEMMCFADGLWNTEDIEDAIDKGIDKVSKP